MALVHFLKQQMSIVTPARKLVTSTTITGMTGSVSRFNSMQTPIEANQQNVSSNKGTVTASVVATTNDSVLLIRVCLTAGITRGADSDIACMPWFDVAS